MSEESQLQVKRKDDESSLILSSARSSLVARGRRDAALLTLEVRAESEEQRSSLFPGWDAPWDELGDRSTEDVQKDAEQGDAKHQSILAFSYMFGARRDLAESARWYRKAADQGYAPAQFNLGWMYDNRYLGVPGVGQDYVEAANWYRKAADQGYAPAQFNLGVMHDSGEGVAENRVQAAKWCRKAADQGLSAAQFNLGIKYENGEGVRQDSTEAATWYRKAADQGFSKAQFNLGLKYANGQGVVQDYVQAHMWMDLAAPRANIADGKRYAATRDRVAAKMNPAQFVEAQRLALEWETNRRGESIAKHEGNLTVRCNKCGERKELVFAGCVCASCSEALDRQWAGSAATDWLVTRPDNSVGDRVSDFVLLNTTYAQMKKYSWAANDTESRIQGFFRFRQATPEEIVHLKSQWGIWSHASGARIVRPATRQEVEAQKQREREWQIAMDTDEIIREACEKLGIQMNEHLVPVGDPQRIEQAAEEIAGRLRQLGWLKELAEMKREDSDALHAMDGARLLEMVLRP